MLGAQLDGAGIQSSLRRKKGLAKMVHPMVGSCSCGLFDLNFSIIACRDSRDAAPFFSTNASHAKDKGRLECLTKKPPPAMKLSGLCSLNRNGAPGGIAWKDPNPPGRQKLTSSGLRLARKSNHLLCYADIELHRAANPLVWRSLT
jgi:hypothetical protein